MFAAMSKIFISTRGYFFLPISLAVRLAPGLASAAGAWIFFFDFVFDEDRPEAYHRRQTGPKEGSWPSLLRPSRLKASRSGVSFARSPAAARGWDPPASSAVCRSASYEGKDQTIPPLG